MNNMKKLSPIILVLSLLLVSCTENKTAKMLETCADENFERYNGNTAILTVDLKAKLLNIRYYSYHEINIRDMQSKDIYFYDNLKSSADITVIDGDRSYNFKGFKNNGSNSTQHNFIFLNQSNTLFADLQATSFDTGIAVEFDVTSFDSALDKITKGTCKAIY